MRRLLSRQENAYRLSEPEIVPIGGEAVLRAVAKLIAASDTGDTFQLHPGLNPGGLERRVLLLMRKVPSPAAERQVGVLLDALQWAELITRDSRSISLPLPPERPVVIPTLPMGSYRVKQIPKSLGSNAQLSSQQAEAKQQAMDDGRAAGAAGDVAGLIAAWERIFAIQPKLRKPWQSYPSPGSPTQSALLLAIPGGIGRAVGRPADIQSEYERDIQDGPASDIEIRADGDFRPDIGASCAASDDDDDSNRISSPESSSSSPREDIAKSSADIRPTDPAISDMAAEYGRTFAASIGKPGQADLLAGEIIHLVTKDPAKAHQIPELVQRAGRLYSGGDHVSSPAALLRTMYQNERPKPVSATPRREPGPAAAGSPPKVDPRIAAEPTWAAQPAEVQAVIVTLIDELERLGPAKHGGRSWIKYYAGQGHSGFSLVEQKRPEVRRIVDVGWDAYLEERTSARDTAPAAGD